MASDPDGLWPRKTDAASEGRDEDRDIDDIADPLEVDLRPDVEVDAEWMIDADQRPVALEDEDEGRGTEADAPDLDE